MKNALATFICEKGVTLQEVADLCGLCGKNHVSMHLKGIRQITAECALKYHKGLGIPLSDLRPDLWPPEPAPPENADV